MPLHMLTAFCLQHHFSIKSSFIRFWSTKALINCHLKPLLRFPSPYSYAEVRAEKRRELGIEESQPEMTVEKVRLSQEDLWNAYCTELIRHHTFTAIPGFGLRVSAQHLQPEGGSGPLQPQSDTFGVISQLTQILSHRGVRPQLWVSSWVRKPRLRFSMAVHRVSLSFPASQMKIQGDRSTPGRQSVSAVEMTSQRRSSISSQVGLHKFSHGKTALWNVPHSFYSFFHQQSMSSQNTGQNMAPTMIAQQPQQQQVQQQVQSSGQVRRLSDR